MQLNGDLYIDAPRERVWQALNDPQVLQRSVPGCEDVQQTTPTETLIRVAVRLGPVRARFVGKILMSDVRPDEGCSMAFEGSGGAAGFAKGQATVSLSSEGGGTRLRYTTEAAVGGKLGQIGGRLIDASAKQMADQFFVAFGQQLGVTAAPAAVAAETATGLPAAEPALRPAAVAPASVARQHPSAPAGLASEGVRVLWFLLGAASTGFGVWLMAHLGR